MQWADEHMFPHISKEQKTRHIGVKKGDVSNRVITMGSTSRAKEMANLLDSHQVCIENENFLVINGTYNNVPVSIICCGIGFPNMDTMVREVRSIVDGTLLFIRIGTAGSSHNEVDVGNLVIASKGSTYLQRNPDAFSENNNSKNHYTIFDSVNSDQELSRLILENIKEENKGANRFDVTVHEGVNASTDFFYGSQGRKDLNFTDYNEQLLETLYRKYPEVKSIEMETYHLFDLARHCKSTIRASAIVIIRSHRLKTGTSITKDQLLQLEQLCGIAVLKAITSCNIP